jgi:hypothetical protein
VIEVEVTYDRSDYVRAIRFMSRRQNRASIGLMVIGGVVLALLLYGADPADFKWWVVPVIFGLIIFFYSLIRIIQSSTVARQLKSVPSAHGPHIWAIGREGIRISGELSNTEIKWEAVIKARESANDFFFYLAPRFARFLPKRTLSGEQQVADLKHLISETLGKKAQLI